MPEENLMDNPKQVNFMHTYEDLEACRDYVKMFNLPAIVLCLFNGDRTLYTFCLQSSIDVMQEEMNKAKAVYVENK
jgi:hypothetical protein